jgi:predicted HD superfamily hydrolase involved in NAD metabolism
VARLAASLARRHGADPAAAALAGWLHDWLKPWPAARLRRACARYHEVLDDDTRRKPVLWHGPAAAAWARRELGVRDRAVLDAVRWHTTGRSRMTPLDRVLFVADFCAEGRTHPEAAVARRLARRDLTAAARYVIACKLAWVRAQGGVHHPAGLAAWRDLAARGGGRA